MRTDQNELRVDVERTVGAKEAYWESSNERRMGRVSVRSESRKDRQEKV